MTAKQIAIAIGIQLAAVVVASYIIRKWGYMLPADFKPLN